MMILLLSCGAPQEDSQELCVQLYIMQEEYMYLNHQE